MAIRLNESQIKYLGINGQNLGYNLYINGTTYAKNRIYTDEWIQFSGVTGLYWPNNNGLHIQPNNIGSFGGALVKGQKGGYHGILLGDSTSHMIVMSSETHQGLYNQGTGRWILHYNNTDDNIGLGTVSVSGYKVTILGDTYVNGNSTHVGRVNVKSSYPTMGMNSDGSYWGLGDPDGGSANWIRTTTNGLIPSKSGGASALGTESWPFNSIWIKSAYIVGTYYPSFAMIAQTANSASTYSKGMVETNYTGSIGMWIHSDKSTDAKARRGLVVYGYPQKSDATQAIALRQCDTAGTWQSDLYLLHSGNFTTYLNSTYVNVSGDTMTGRLAISYAHTGGGMFQLMSTSSNEASIDYAAGGTSYWVVGKGCGGTGNETFAWWYNPNGANAMSLTKDGVLTVSQLVGTAKYLARNGDTSIPMVFNWSGQSGQPSWLWGGNDGTNMYVYNPSNFSVNYANSAGYTTRWDMTASNPTTTDTDNSTGYFNKTGSHIYWYTTAGLVNNQPSQYGYILDIGSYSERHQIWMIQPHGDMYHRGGNGSGWGGAWKTILDSSNYSSYSLPLSGGTVSGVITINNGNSSGYLQLYEDTEGGTIKIVGPNATYAWEMDAYNNSTFRIFTNGSGSYKFFTFDGSSGAFSATSVYGAVWNDYAEYRSAETIAPGRVVQESVDGIMKLTTARLQAGCEIISDTFGFAIGKTENCQAPIAVAGRVLAYPYENRNSFELGQAVCSGPNGTVSKMTREEVMMYPERIIGTVSEIPEYETWGTGNINVDGRIWIRIK